MSGLFALLMLVSLVCLIIGLVKPSIFSKLFKKNATRGKLALIFGGAFILFIILTGVTAPPTKTDDIKTTIAETTKTLTPEEQAKIAAEDAAAAKKKVDDEVATIAVADAKAKAETDARAKTTPTTTKTPTPATTPTPNPTPTPTPVSSETISQINAVKSAKSYLGISGFSHDGLVAQLEFEQFSHADAVYGADNSGANWNEQAAKSAKQYMELSAFSRGSLIEQLKFEKYTQGQAEYGANAVGL